MNIKVNDDPLLYELKNIFLHILLVSAKKYKNNTIPYWVYKGAIGLPRWDWDVKILSPDRHLI